MIKVSFFNPKNGYSAVYKLHITKEDRGYTVIVKTHQCNKYTGTVYASSEHTEWIPTLEIIEKWVSAQKVHYSTCYCNITR